jgi:hypothetical protein
MMSTKAFVPNPKDFKDVLEAMASPCREMGDRLEVCRVLVHERWGKNQACTASPPSLFFYLNMRFAERRTNTSE